MFWHILSPTNISALNPQVLCGAKDTYGNTTRGEFVPRNMFNGDKLCPECAKQYVHRDDPENVKARSPGISQAACPDDKSIPIDSPVSGDRVHRVRRVHASGKRSNKKTGSN